MTHGLVNHETSDTITTKYNAGFPFVFNDSVNYLEEDELTNTYTLRGPTRKVLGNTPFKKIVTSDRGEYILLQAKSDNTLMVLNAGTGELINIASGQEPAISAAFSEEKKLVVVSSGNRLFVADLVTSATRSICDSIRDRKINPSVYGDSIYFSSYNGRDYYSIWSCHINDAVGHPRLILADPGHDLRLPQKWNNTLYFIRIENSQYLLQTMDLRTGQIKAITTKGVVYNYKVTGDRIVYVYTDMQTPRGIRYMDTAGTTREVMKRTEPDSLYRYEQVYKDENKIPAFEIRHKNAGAVKGVILYFHPGRNNDDYSPRWDNMILPFCGNGYVVIAPNFPSSTGYGKAYEQLSMNDATKYMGEWIRYIRKKYQGTPVYLYGISSGGPLMEITAVRNNKEIAGIISAFGLTQNNSPNQNIPSFYLLGKYDPIINHDERTHELSGRKENGHPVTVLSLENEKHWIQHPANFRKFYSEVFAFLEKNTDR